MADDAPALPEHDPTELSFIGLSKTGQLPAPADVRLTKWDCNQLAWSSVTTCTVLHEGAIAGDVDVGKFRAAFQRVVNKNPILAGRLVEEKCAAAGMSAAASRTVGDSEEQTACSEAKPPAAAAAAQSGRVVYISWPEEEQLGATFEVRMLEESQEAQAGKVLSSVGAVVKHAVELKDLFRDLKLREPGSGEEQIVCRSPLACMTLFIGANISLLCLSISHAVGDGFTYYHLLRALDEEYASPGSSVPGAGREGVDAAIEAIWQSYTAKELAAQQAFFPGMYMANIEARDIESCFELRVQVHTQLLETMRERALKSLPSPGIVSKQDALSAWIANQCSAKFVSYIVNIRGRCPEIHPLSLCNGEMIWYAAASGNVDDPDGTSPGGDAFKATDMRSSIGNRGAHTHFDMAAAEACAETPAAVVGTNSWLKVQYLPRFGGRAGLHVPVYTWESLPVVCRTVSNLLYSLNQKECVLHHWGLDRSQVRQLTKAWVELGAQTMTVIPGKLVLERTSSPEQK
eukprot:INCI1114.5.p1 GENE.INCI1114.5~~INCI1114.5.p1  ORF type:complete len:516 (-),score=79.21 INCI1114.5:26-1573(-)